MLYFSQLIGELFHQLISLEAVVLAYPLDFNLGQAHDIFFGNRAIKLFLKRLQPLVYRTDYRLPGLTLLYVTVNAVFDKYFLQRSEQQLFFQLTLAYFQFAGQQLYGLLCVMPQNIDYAQKLRLVIHNHTSIG